MKKLLLTLALLGAAALFTPSRAQGPAWLDHVKPGGYLQTGFSFNNAFDNPTFYVKRARFSVVGDLYKSPEYGRLEYKIQAEFAGSPKLVDIFFKYTVCEAFGVQFGQFKTPLTIENSEYFPTKLEIIDYSLLVQRFAHMSAQDLAGVNSTGRDCGIQFYGKLFPADDGHARIAYNLALFNGTGINKNDNDKSKDLMGRVMYYPIKDLAVAASFSRRIGVVDVDYEYPVTADYDVRLLDRYGFGVAYDGPHAYARTEWMAGHTNGTRAQAVYLTAGYKVSPKFFFGARYDYFDTDTLLPDTEQNYIAVGCCYAPFKSLRIQLNYTHKQDPGGVTNNVVNLMTTIIY